MSSPTFEQEILVMINDMEREKQAAQNTLEVARATIAEKEEELTASIAILKRYRKKHGLPTNLTDPNPEPISQYANLGPGRMIDLWATMHDGEVVVKEVVRVALDAGVYKHYRQAYSILQSTARRRKGYERVGPGHYRRAENRNGHSPAS